MARKRPHNPCRCGCGEVSITGQFAAGHDTRHLHNLKKDAGGWSEIEQAVKEYLERKDNED